ncbi:DNA-3-methyladenine glycosylase I [Spirosoma soli]|uniref:DNA-3-methyladenine glycosylase I n=1 Tax=Spirosoma soli TaxID=1770529 RepID=A0ABW5M1A3_9BACT
MTNRPSGCGWFERQPYLHDFHAHEWGEPVRDTDLLFEYIVLHTFSVGIGLLLVLKKREHFRDELAGFDPERLARLGPAQLETLLANPRLIRNRRKLEAAVANARAWLTLQEQIGSSEGILSFFYDFVDGSPLDRQRPEPELPPVSIPQSEGMSGELRKRGFSLLGPATCYGLMQTAGLVNDHAVSCFRHPVCIELASNPKHR